METKTKIDGRTLGVAFWQKDDKGQDDVIVASGKCILKNNQLFMLIDNLGIEIPILDNWIERIKRLEGLEIKKIFHESDYGLSLKVSDLSEGANSKLYKKLGLILNE